MISATGKQQNNASTASNPPPKPTGMKALLINNQSGGAFGSANKASEAAEALSNEMTSTTRQSQQILAELEGLEKSLKQAMILRRAQNHPTSHFDAEQGNVSILGNQTPLEICESLIAKASIRLKEATERRINEEKLREKKNHAQQEALQKQILETRTKYRLKHSLQDAGPVFLHNAFSGFGEVVHVEAITSQLYLVFSSNGHVELWDSKSATFTGRDQRAMERLEMNMQDLTITCKEKVTCAIRLPVAFVDAPPSASTEPSVRSMAPSVRVSAEHLDSTEQSNPPTNVQSDSVPLEVSGGFEKALKSMLGDDVELLMSEEEQTNNPVLENIPLYFFMGTESGLGFVGEFRIVANQDYKKIEFEPLIERQMSKSPIVQACLSFNPMPLLVVAVSEDLQQTGTPENHLVGLSMYDFEVYWRWHVNTNQSLDTAMVQTGNSILKQVRGKGAKAPTVEQKKILAICNDAKGPFIYVSVTGGELHRLVFFKTEVPVTPAAAMNKLQVKGPTLKLKRMPSASRGHSNSTAVPRKPYSDGLKLGPQLAGLHKDSDSTDSNGSLNEGYKLPEIHTPDTWPEGISFQLQTALLFTLLTKESDSVTEAQFKDMDKISEQSQVTNLPPPPVNMTSMQNFAPIRIRKNMLAVGCDDGTIRLLSLDDGGAEWYATRVNENMLGPVSVAVYEYFDMSIILAQNGSGMFQAISAERKEILSELRVLLNRNSLEENISQFREVMSLTGSNSKLSLAGRLMMPRRVHVVNPRQAYFVLTVGNEWSIVSIKNLRDWLRSNSHAPSS